MQNLVARKKLEATGSQAAVKFCPYKSVNILHLCVLAIADSFSLHAFRLKQCLEKGAEKGFWKHVSGAITQGTYELSIDQFDPTDGE